MNRGLFILSRSLWLIFNLLVTYLLHYTTTKLVKWYLGEISDAFN